MSDIKCPSEEQLWPIVVDEEVQDHVQQHLDACPSCQELVEGMRLAIATVRKAADESSKELESTTEWPTIAQIGRYRILSKLNEGGQSIVYRAIDPNLAQEVVLKLSKRKLSSAGDDRDRIVREGRLLVELDHPHLARVFDLGFHEGHPFLVLKYVRGVDVRRHVSNGQLSHRQTAGLIARVARAAAAAHEFGVLHQDIKPANIVVDDTGRPMLIDFGMALLRTAWQDEAIELDSIGGTAAFMAPEQARGEVEQLGPAADIFALGATLFCLLTDQAPFAAKNVKESLRRSSDCEFDKSLLGRAGVPDRLSQICLTAMNCDQRKRYASATDLADELDNFAKASSFSKRFVLACAIGLPVLGAASVVGVLSLLNGQTPQVEPEVVVEARRTKTFRPLSTVPPLSIGDEVQIRGVFPKNYAVGAFQIDADGKLESLTDHLEVVETKSALEILYPRSDERSTVREPAGTTVLFVCARPKSAVTFEEVKACHPEISKWPTLPPNSTVEFDNDRTWPSNSRSSFNIERSPARPVLTRAEELRCALRERFEFVYGIAFPHTE